MLDLCVWRAFDRCVYVCVTKGRVSVRPDNGPIMTHWLWARLVVGGGGGGGGSVPDSGPDWFIAIVPRWPCAIPFTPYQCVTWSRLCCSCRDHVVLCATMNTEPTNPEHTHTQYELVIVVVVVFYDDHDSKMAVVVVSIRTEVDFKPIQLKWEPNRMGPDFLPWMFSQLIRLGEYEWVFDANLSFFSFFLSFFLSLSWTRDLRSIHLRALISLWTFLCTSRVMLLLLLLCLVRILTRYSSRPCLLTCECVQGNIINGHYNSVALASLSAAFGVPHQRGSSLSMCVCV